eukprot:GFUD01007060.1.p1 GENE.GFUD01007060.1~~GFUD01007060.1.p1  ORF type:complete len:649 (+),score=134.81 GFUD01007060.1:224-1948(+)
MSLEEYESLYMIGDDGSSNSDFYEPTDEYWYNKCIWKCNICGNKNRSLGSSKKHVHKMHNISYEDYIAQYGNQGIVEHDFTCTICQATMSCNGVTISSHLSNIHKLTLQEYENKYVKETITADTKDNLDMDDKSTINLLTPITEMDGAAGGEVNLKIKEEKMEQPDSNLIFNVQNLFQDVTKEDRPWYQQCLYVCQICQSTYYSTSALNNHAKVKHNIEREQYLVQFGTKGKLIEDYTCKICNRVMKCEGKALGSHMKNVHKMSIEEYTRVHEPDRNTEQDPHFYNESYQIEMDDQDDDDAMEDIGIDHDTSINETSKDSVYDPLADIEIANVVSGENLDFSFEDEESIASEDYIEGFGHPKILENKADINKTPNTADQNGGTVTLDKQSINTQTIKNIVSKTLFESATKAGNSLNNNCESLAATSHVTGSPPANHAKEKLNEDITRSPALPEGCQVEDSNVSLPLTESHSIISLELLDNNDELDKNDESFTSEPDAPSDDAQLPTEHSPHRQDESNHPQNIEPELSEYRHTSEQTTASAAEDTSTIDDFPEIDFSSISMGVLELDSEEGNPLG